MTEEEDELDIDEEDGTGDLSTEEIILEFTEDEIDDLTEEFDCERPELAENLKRHILDQTL